MESGSFGFDLSGGSGVMKIGGFIVVGPTTSVSRFPGQVGIDEKFGPKRRRHYIAKL